MNGNKLADGIKYKIQYGPVSLMNFLRFAFLNRRGRKIKAELDNHMNRLVRWRLDRGSRLAMGKQIENGGRMSIVVGKKGSLSIGNHVYFNENVNISCLGTISIGDETLFGPDVRIFDNNHLFGRQGVSRDCKAGNIRIGKNCWIASDVTLLSGADIEDNCVIGAGCIIKSRIPAGSLVQVQQNLSVSSIHD